MKKILTTTVITAIFATSGFSADNDQVGLWVYGIENFTNGTDRNPTTIMPSGTVTIGDPEGGSIPVIASTWTLEEGSTMNVMGCGFKLTGTIKINPNDAKETYVQCDIKKNGTLYYEYQAEDGTLYYKLVNTDSSATGDWVNGSGEKVTPTGEPKQVKTTTVTGVPQLDDIDERDNTVIDMAYGIVPKTTILPENAKVVKYDTSDLSTITPTDLSGKTFYVYCGEFGGTETEVYSPCYCTSFINILWKGASAKGKAFLSTSIFGTSDLYVKGVPTESGLNCDYYTALACESDAYLLVGDNNVTNVSFKFCREVQGCISGGTVTYAKQNDPVLSEDSTSLADTSLKDLTGNKYKLSKAESNGFTDGYLSKFPTLCYRQSKKIDKTLNVSDTTAYQNGELDGKDTLESYLNSFGFYPNEVSISKSNIELLATKSKDDAIQIPQNYEFTKDADGTEYKVKTNLHNVGVAAFENALSFTGTGAGSATIDTLEFSGDNSNLKPEAGVTYTDVNVTFECKNSWIEPKDGGISFIGNSTKPTLSMNADTSISQTLTVSHANLSIGSKNIVKILGTLNLN